MSLVSEVEADSGFRRKSSIGSVRFEMRRFHQSLFETRGK